MNYLRFTVIFIRQYDLTNFISKEGGDEKALNFKRPAVRKFCYDFHLALLIFHAADATCCFSWETYGGDLCFLQNIQCLKYGVRCIYETAKNHDFIVQRTLVYWFNYNAPLLIITTAWHAINLPFYHGICGVSRVKNCHFLYMYKRAPQALFTDWFVFNSFQRVPF